MDQKIKALPTIDQQIWIMDIRVFRPNAKHPFFTHTMRYTHTDDLRAWQPGPSLMSQFQVKLVQSNGSDLIFPKIVSRMPIPSEHCVNKIGSSSQLSGREACHVY